jgi:hypothetical protein
MRIAAAHNESIVRTLKAVHEKKQKQHRSSSDGS